MSVFVLDNSVSAAWCFEDQCTAYTSAVLQAVAAGATIVVPAIWRLELVNALVVGERRKKILPEKSSAFLRAVEQFDIVTDTRGIDLAFSEVYACASRYHRSAYDASYLELAKREGIALATKDEPLRKAADQLGVAIFEP